MSARRKRWHAKAANEPVTTHLLQRRRNAAVNSGYSPQRWVQFCEVLLEKGYELRLYEARKTRSKYITVRKNGYPDFKVRFSNHKPIAAREIAGDCDFFVGVTHLGITHTGQALAAVRHHFGEDMSGGLFV